MSAVAAQSQMLTDRELELATFYVGDMLMGIDIRQIQEIGRQVESTGVPHAPTHVRGVVNLRGEVVTVIDLRTVLELPSSSVTQQTRNVIVNSKGERVGLLVDRVADVVIVATSEIEPPPANLAGVDGRFFTGVFKLENELLIILDVEEVLGDENHRQP
jgi:purine-binding chemotaxis protein CheW